MLRCRFFKTGATPFVVKLCNSWRFSLRVLRVCQDLEALECFSRSRLRVAAGVLLKVSWKLSKPSTSKRSCSVLQTSVPKPDGATIAHPLKWSSSFQYCGAAAAFRCRFKSLFAAAKILPTSPSSASLASSQESATCVSKCEIN